LCFFNNDKKYTIIEVDDHLQANMLNIINDNGFDGWYDKERFILLKEQREKKLKRILK
jgi:hypothetical protein